MTERKFTDEEVIKALECLAGAEGSCVGCIYQRTPFPTCRELVARQALDLINRQRVEIEKWQLAYDCADSALRELSVTRSEAIKEFAERLKEKMNNLSRMEYHCDPYFLVSKDFIDKTAKELTESKPCTEGADCSTEEGKG